MAGIASTPSLIPSKNLGCSLSPIRLIRAKVFWGVRTKLRLHCIDVIGWIQGTPVLAISLWTPLKTARNLRGNSPSPGWEMHAPSGFSLAGEFNPPMSKKVCFF
jgi:hypothetical protein